MFRGYHKYSVKSRFKKKQQHPSAYLKHTHTHVTHMGEKKKMFASWYKVILVSMESTAPVINVFNNSCTWILGLGVGLLFLTSVLTQTAVSHQYLRGLPFIIFIEPNVTYSCELSETSGAFLIGYLTKIMTHLVLQSPSEILVFYESVF